MTNIGSDFGLIQDVLLAIGLFGGVVLYRKNSIPQKNVANLTSLTDTYERRIKALEDELKENHQIQLKNVAAISDLQGQVKVYKELHLQELANGIKEVVVLQKETVSLLSAKARIDAEDRDVLTNQNMLIRNEVAKEMSK